MARIALGITLALLLVTCFFGFETKSKVQSLNDSVTAAKGEASTANQQLAKKSADLKTAEEKATKAQADADSAKSDLESAKSDADAAKKQASDDDAKIAQLTAQIATSGTSGPQTPQGPAPDADAIAKLNAQLKDAQAQVSELTQVKETLTNKANDADSRAAELEKVVERYKGGTVRNGLQGEVLAVNPGWNFCVLSIGDRQGAVTNAEMILTRGGAQIGKVRITSVEPSTSVADIIPGSLARGVRVQPGDHVIFPGS